MFATVAIGALTVNGKKCLIFMKCVFGAYPNSEGPYQPMQSPCLISCFGDQYWLSV